MQRVFLKYRIISVVLSALLFSHMVSAQGSDGLFIIDPSIAPPDFQPIDPLEGLPSLPELESQGGMLGSSSNPESILPQDLAEDYGYRLLEDSGADSLLFIDPFTNDHYSFTQENFLNGEGPQFLDDNSQTDMGSVGAVLLFQPNTSVLCCFYRRLPQIILGSSTDNGPVEALGFDTITNIAASQNALSAALDGFKQSPLSRDAFVKSGLLHSKDILLIENDNGNNVYQGSPSQYKNVNKTIYINEEDLKEYGYVVILHELIQAGLDHGLSWDYINDGDFTTIRSVGEDYFPNLQLGYVNSREFLGVENFTTIKAFAFGQTYKLLKQHYSALSSAERTKARRFFNDIENNKYLFPLTISLSTGGSASIDFHLMGSPSRISQRDIDDYTDSFVDENSAVNKSIQPVEDKISRGVNKYVFSRLIPAVTMIH